MKTYAPHEDRVINELEELDLNTEKLSHFIDTAPFCDLSPTDRALLTAQLGIMEAYLCILQARVDGFTPSLAN